MRIKATYSCEVIHASMPMKLVGASRAVMHLVQEFNVGTVYSDSFIYLRLAVEDNSLLLRSEYNTSTVVDAKHQ